MQEQSSRCDTMSGQHIYHDQDDWGYERNPAVCHCGRKMSTDEKSAAWDQGYAINMQERRDRATIGLPPHGDSWGEFITRRPRTPDVLDKRERAVKRANAAADAEGRRLLAAARGAS